MRRITLRFKVHKKLVVYYIEKKRLSSITKLKQNIVHIFLI